MVYGILCMRTVNVQCTCQKIVKPFNLNKRQYYASLFGETNPLRRDQIL